MKRIFTISLCFMLIILSFSACSKTDVKKIKNSMDYYNQKVINNIDSLIGTAPENVEKWIYETFSEDEIKEAKVNNSGAGPSYLSKDETIKIFFILEEDSNRFFVEPNYDKYNLTQMGKPFINNQYKQLVQNYCDSKNADYKQAPTLCELSLYNFDKADESTNLVYWYLFNDSGTWGWEGDTGLFARSSFVLENGSFVCEQIPD